MIQNLRHHRVAAVQRRAPVPEPQLGFDPTAVFGGHSQTKTSGRGVTNNLYTSTTKKSTSSATTKTTSRSTSSASTSASSVTSASSSSTLSTTTSVTPSTTTTSSAPPPPTSTSDVITTLPTRTAVVTVSISHTSSSSSTTSSASATNTADSSTGMSTGAIVGGIGAGFVAIIAIVFAIVFFIRRSRKRGDNFDSHEFRRSAVLLDDPPTHDDTVSRGFNPRPPTMIERHLNSPAPTFGTQYGRPGPAYNEYAGEYANNVAGYGASNFQSIAPGQVFNSFGPGQVLNMNNVAPSPISATSPPHPMYFNPDYTQSPFSGSPIAPHDQYVGQGYSGHGQPSADVAAYPVLVRQGSGASPTSQHSRLPTPTEIQRESGPSDYVDLDRSSVSPFQAEQYKEISRRLNAEVPTGLQTTEIEKDLPPPSNPSQFADPVSAPPSPGGQYAIDRRNLERSNSGGSLASQTLDFPVPPSPAHTVTSRYRINSTPPTLPEIYLESRVSVGNYPMMARSSGMGLDMGISPGLTPGNGSRFPTTPSPLASSFAMPSPFSDGPLSPGDGPAAAPSSLRNEISAPEAAISEETNKNSKKRATTYSMFDAEDAYGGI